MREQEQIEAILCKFDERVPNMHSTRIVISILRRLLTLTPDPSLMVAWVYTTLIEQVAHQLADDPEKWTYQGHFSPARFDYFFPTEEHSQVTFLGVLADLREVLMKLEEEYPGVFRTSEEAEQFACLIESEANSMGFRFKPQRTNCDWRHLAHHYCCPLLPLSGTRILSVVSFHLCKHGTSTVRKDFAMTMPGNTAFLPFQGEPVPRVGTFLMQLFPILSQALNRVT